MKLTQIARKTLEARFENKEFELDKETKQELSEKKACFVTLTINSQLRGCIGSLEARDKLWKDIQENAINAAFHDPRFTPLTKQELEKTRIEVSVLSKPKKIGFENHKELLEKINKKMGIILKFDFYTSTFLPQVWEQIPDKKQFLQALSQKAGLSKSAWKEAEVLYYNVNVEKE